MVRRTKEQPVAEKSARRTRTKEQPVEEKPVRRSRSAGTEISMNKRGSIVGGTPEIEKPARRTRTKEQPAEEKPARRARSKEVSAEPEKKVRKPKEDVPVIEFFNPLTELDDKLDKIEKSVGISDATLNKNEKRMSTGQLQVDLMLGGGITAGWYTMFGQEQSCKTTEAVHLLASALKANVPILYYCDYEGSAEPNYIENILKNMGVNMPLDNVFGVKDEKTAKWVIPPRVRYRSEAVAEKFFDTLAQIQRMLPDKVLIGENWYYVFENTKENQKKLSGKYDKTYFSKHNKFRVPAPDGSLQAVVLVDSYPAMLPEKQDVDDPNNAIASQARMFSDQLKRVKGKMRSKRIAVIGINQLRLRPMVMGGNPEYEPGGEALKLYSDVRIKHTSRALSAVGAKGQGQVEEEKSVNIKGGVDNYRYIHMRAFKNKLSRPYLECFQRMWISDGNGEAHGFDPVWDTFQYLVKTGQVAGTRNKGLKLKLHKKELCKAISWFEFKRLILGDKAIQRHIYETLGMKPINLREFCFRQVESGLGTELFVEQLKVKEGSKDEVEDSDEEDSEAE